MRTLPSLSLDVAPPALESCVAIGFLPFPAAILDRASLIIEANPEWQASYPDAAPGTTFASWSESAGCAPDVGQALVSGVQKLLSGLEARFNQEFTVGAVQHRFSAVPCPSGIVVMDQILGASQDSDPQSQKMQIVGRLVSGVAHDFANLLTLIAGYSDILLNRIGEKDPLRPELDEIRKAANRGSRLTSQLLGFSRSSAVQPRPLDLNALISDMQRMLRPILGEYVELQTVLRTNPGKVLVDAGQMEQVIMNLLLNARDAIQAAGGQIRIETSACELDEAAALRHEMAPGPCVLLSITDNGHGIDPDLIEHIFEPFFTTKEKGKGTGLGLSTVYGIVKDAGGDINVASVPGKGSTFTICLPCVQQPAESAEVPAQPRPAGAGSETVLLVEDEDGVRKLLTHVLHRRGYHVLEAPSAEEALRIFERDGADIHLVLTDMVMPKMSGRELADRLLAIRPDIRVIYMSGYTDDVLLRTGALGPGMSFLQKPLRPDHLAAKIREALDSPSRPFNPR